MPEELIFCPVRAQWVKLTPEEKVRQHLLSNMIHQLGYPPSLIVVEKKIKELSHLGISQNVFPNRRIDILCYATGLHRDVPLYPLLLIECKAAPLRKAAMRQLAGYNFFVKALFFSVANEKSIQIEGLNIPSGSLTELPSYSELLEKCRLYFKS